MRRSVALFALVLLAGSSANATALPATSGTSSSCAGGSYSVVNSPDGTTLSILFDNFSIATTAAAAGGVEKKSCNIQVPLNLPAGFSLGVYKVDYRGYSHLSVKQEADLTVEYALGPRANGRKYHRKIQGASDGEFAFSETIGAGLMKRVGCGEAATLNVAPTLVLQTVRHPGEAMVALDSIDGAPKGGLTYHLDLKKCGS